MVADIPDEIIDALLDGSHTSRYVVDALYGGAPAFPALPVAFDSGNITLNRTSRLQATGRMLIRSEAYDQLQGRTLEPAAYMDPLAPFGQELEVRLEVSLGQRVIGATPLGRFVIDDVPSSERTARKMKARTVSEAAVVEVSFSSQLSRIDADEFTSPTSPKSGASTWQEFRRLSPLPIEVSGSDRSMASAIVYKESRLDALNDLAAHLGGFLLVTRQGVLTVRSDTPDLADVDVDLTGTITEMGNSLSRDIYNCVVVRATAAGAFQIVAVAEITDGPLSVNGPLGRRVYRRSSPLVTTQTQANAEAATWLQKVSSQQTKTVQVRCLPNPLVELGDVVSATDPASGREETGIVDGIVWSMDPTDLMTITILIPQEVIPWA